MEGYNLTVDEIMRLRRGGGNNSEAEQNSLPPKDVIFTPRGRGRGLNNTEGGRRVPIKSLDQIITERGIKKPQYPPKATAHGSKSHNGGQSDLFKSLDEIIGERGITKPKGPLKVTFREPKNSIEDQSDLSKSLDEIIGERGITKPLGLPLVAAGEDSQKKAEIERPVLLLHQGGQRPVKKIKLRPIDPCTNALDDIIEQADDESESSLELAEGRSMPTKRKFGSDDNIRDNTAVSKMNAGPSGQRNAPNLTPYRAVGYLSKKGMIVEMKIGKLVDDTGDRSHLWRCVITCGAIIGITDSIRKAVAREMASLQFLQQIREVYKDCHIPRYEVFPELFIDPRIVRALENAAGERSLNISDEVRVRPMKSGGAQGSRQIHFYLFVCTYYVGTETFKAESHLIEYARLAAARKAYEGITGRESYPTKYFTGDECDPALEYSFSESESHLTVTRLEDVDQGKIPMDLDEEKREVARATLSERFKKARVDEENRRRNMIVDVGHQSEN